MCKNRNVTGVCDSDEFIDKFDKEVRLMLIVIDNSVSKQEWILLKDIFIRLILFFIKKTEGQYVEFLILI